MTIRTLLFLPQLAGLSNVILFGIRLAIGAFLIWGVWDNLASSERMREFVAFLVRFGFPRADLMARVSVWAQFLIGISFITGALTRWAGIVCAINFIVAIAMVDRFDGVRGAFPSACLVLIGLYLATHGAGRLGLDAMLEHEEKR